MTCRTCGNPGTDERPLCSAECRDAARGELARNRARLRKLRRTGRPPCAEANELMDRNSQLQEALQHAEAFSVAVVRS